MGNPVVSEPRVRWLCAAESSLVKQLVLGLELCTTTPSTVCLLWGRDSPSSPCWPRIYNPPASVTRVLEWQAPANSSSSPRFSSLEINAFLHLFIYLFVVLCVSLFPPNHLASHPLIFFGHLSGSFVGYNLFSPHFLLLLRVNVRLRWHWESQRRKPLLCLKAREARQRRSWGEPTVFSEPHPHRCCVAVSQWCGWPRSLCVLSELSTTEFHFLSHTGRLGRWYQRTFCRCHFATSCFSRPRSFCLDQSKLSELWLLVLDFKDFITMTVLSTWLIPWKQIRISEKSSRERQRGNKAEQSSTVGMTDAQLSTGKTRRAFCRKEWKTTLKNRGLGSICVVTLQRCVEDRRVAHMK